MRLCARCGEAPTLTPRHKYCGTCRDEAEREYALRNRALQRASDTPEKRRERWRREAERGRPPASQRGYGTEHRKLRKQWAVLVEAGEVCCARCGMPIPPGTRWHLDHDDEDRTRYLGPSHASCNTNSLAQPLTAENLERRRRYRAKLSEESAEKREALYGKEHGKLRKEWARKVATGTIFCVRCLERIARDDPWDLGHDDLDPELYTGPEHRRCNRRAGGLKAHQRWGPPPVTSRDWLPS